MFRSPLTIGQPNHMRTHQRTSIISRWCQVHANEPSAESSPYGGCSDATGLDCSTSQNAPVLGLQSVMTSCCRPILHGSVPGQDGNKRAMAWVMMSNRTRARFQMLPQVNRTFAAQFHPYPSSHLPSLSTKHSISLTTAFKRD